mmetsp:Transcript_29535/g.56765  ORF Transcript_29535/g.56765 Transcript_29535/m.56765 type:complete len:240 (+) Transcript_29535:248-967(+)
MGSELRFKAVIWDVDGTLAFTTALGFSATNAVLTGDGYPEISENEYQTGTRYTTPQRLAWHATGGLEGGDPSASVGESLGAKFDEYYCKLVSPQTAGFFPGLVELCDEVAASACAQAAVSNACGEYVRAVLATNQVSNGFSIQLGADEVPAPKPAPDGLLMCCEALGLEPSQVVYIGDSPSDGVAAKAAGMHAVGVSWGSHSGEEWSKQFHIVVETVEELRAEIGLPPAHIDPEVAKQY